MQKVIVNRYGGPEVLELVDASMPAPKAGQVLVQLTSIGMNHAELMGRRGHYKASTGEVPFVPGIEGGGVIQDIGEGVDPSRMGQRVTLGPNVPRGIAGPHGGTYRSHIVVDDAVALPAPAVIPDDQLGALWLPYLTAWGCLAWKDKLQPGQIVGIPAASSSVGLAAAQVVKKLGGTTIGLTSSATKVNAIREIENHSFDYLVTTHETTADGRKTLLPWHRQIKQLTNNHGVDVFFDPVAAGDYLSSEVRCLAQGGRIYIYGLLGDPGPIDLSPMVMNAGRIEGWVLYEIVQAGEDVWRPACEAIFDGFITGDFTQQLAATYPLKEVQRAHEEMEQGRHIGKLVLIP